MRFGRKQLVLASLVLALGAAVYLNWQFAGVNKLPVGDSSSTSSELGAAQLVNNAYVETVTDDLQQRGETVTTGSSLSQARLNRQTARDEAIELLDSILESGDADDEAKKEAVDQASLIAQNILQETNVESLLAAKGYGETVVFINNGECSVIVAGELTDADSLIIQEIVLEQTAFSADKVKIIPVQ